jgi:ABC-type Mn2+/Zn2+ transport system ATPase subunit
MIEIQQLTKVYGDKTAVDDLTFTVRPGMVTGFLGPNGAGKSTTMRTIVGLDHPPVGRPWSRVAATSTIPLRCAWWGRCWRRARPTPAAAPSTTSVP